MARQGAVFFAATGLIAGAASIQNLLSIENPAPAGKQQGPLTVIIRQVSPRVVANAAAATPFLVHWGRTTGLPTVGTVLTAQKRLTSDAAPQAIVRQAPTATPAAGDMGVTIPGAFVTAAGWSAPGCDDFVPPYEPDTQLVVLAPGEGVVVWADANSTSWFHSVRVMWHEGQPYLRTQ